MILNELEFVKWFGNDLLGHFYFKN